MSTISGIEAGKYSGNMGKQPSDIVWGHVFQKNCFAFFSRQKRKEAISYNNEERRKHYIFYSLHGTWIWTEKKKKKSQGDFQKPSLQLKGNKRVIGEEF